MNKIIFAGGCFWGVEAYFKQLKGVISTKVGYIDGNKSNPTYEEVCDHIATHAEAVEISYEGISLEELLDHYFRIIDPTAVDRQGPDTGRQYRTGIYYSNESDLNIINQYIKEEQKKYDELIAVEVKQDNEFYSAETYHQDYLEKNPGGYCHIHLDLAKPNEKK
jgi:methionine-S-sulfoxide reductase